MMTDLLPSRFVAVLSPAAFFVALALAWLAMPSLGVARDKNPWRCEAQAPAADGEAQHWDCRPRTPLAAQQPPATQGTQAAASSADRKGSARDRGSAGKARPSRNNLGDFDFSFPPVAPATALKPKRPEPPAPEPSAGQGAPSGMIEDIPEDYWALQLIAFSSRESLEDFVAHEKLKGFKAARLVSSGRIFYVLIEGFYATKAAAEAAARALGPAFEDQPPWIRSLGSLQRAMQKAADSNSNLVDK